MKKFGYLLLVLISLLVSYDSVEAESCDESDIKRLKAIANNVTVDYSYIYDDGSDSEESVYNVYSISIYGLTDEVYIVDAKGNELNYSDAADGVISDYVFSGNVKYYVYSSNCADILLRTINIDLKSFNVYSTYPECEGLSDKLSICDEWYQGNLDYEMFVKKIEEYKNNDDFNDVTDFVSKYYVYIVIGSVILIAGIIFLSIKYRKRSVLE